MEFYVTSGLNEGKYYVEKYKDKIKEKLKISPFFGTLNLIPCNYDEFNNFKNLIEKAEKIYVEPFDEFGGVYFIKCKILKGNLNFYAWIVIPEIKKHNAVEIISDVNLREKLNLKDNDKVKIEIEI
ncbi:MAG: DUF120 domain-containing protein [Candidatus Altarchaeaceae archaeon]